MNPRLTPRRVGRALRRRMRDRLGTHPRVTVLVLVPEGSGPPDACVASVRASVDVVADAVVVPQQAALADVEDGVDYFASGPVWDTPTKPGRTAAGLEVTREVAQSRPTRPWFAIGGIDLERLDEVMAAGATRVVVVRAITDADDPGAAAAEFSRRLRSAG